ncbi:MAG TPA: radical SAM family heme chaperone HemW [Candidatus Paceibacterota bacterium]|nr:radical SAM family heme chaperone HemW [Verrucomicrobiota bacterium]HRY49896.1 radical SAM family heme chaperone HemW [Candidatus Paceibacterota bacterium]HSA03638.1 radical SAM family heme chaperone HemW [Candidatus Paceibacterota bacterium]
MELSRNLPAGGLYVHVPFCARWCDYCAFYSVIAQPDRLERYVRALIIELEEIERDFQPQTLYFGGGTPTLLDLEQWRRIATALRRRGFDRVNEWTVEGNPRTLDSDKVSLLRELGINRFSLGIQSLDDTLLQRLGRSHSRNDALAACALLRNAGFKNLNIDLMFAIPGQTLAQWETTLRETLALEPEHLSCYEVTYEEDTPLYEQLQAGRFSVDEDLACDMYDLLVDLAEQAGFRRYEISNFARHDLQGLDEFPRWSCQHNINYWRGGPYCGLGPSAASYLHGIRWKNWSDVDRYCACLENHQRPEEEREELSPLGRAGELAAFGLRMTAGWPYALFLQITGYDLRREWAATLEDLIKHELAFDEPDRLRLTARGLRCADWVAQQFLL